jgi:hypothetical protein
LKQDAQQVIGMFEGLINKEVIFLSIILHDAYKYGLVKSCAHTESKHDQIIANIVKKNRNIFNQALNDRDCLLLEGAVRYHSGKWSTDANGKFSLNDFTPEILFLHTLDMMSAKDLIKIN